MTWAQYWGWAQKELMIRFSVAIVAMTICGLWLMWKQKK